jgi:hypothetical protein
MTNKGSADKKEPYEIRALSISSVPTPVNISPALLIDLLKRYSKKEQG